MYYLYGVDLYDVNKLICKTNYANQEETDLIQINPTKSLQSTIQWTEGFTTYHPIILKTSLYLVDFYDIALSSIKSFWTFKIDVKDVILPVVQKLSLMFLEIQKLQVVMLKVVIYFLVKLFILLNKNQNH